MNGSRPAESVPTRPTICLCMIVRNEAHVIKRCLDSVRPWIDHWIVCDTGSTDGTQEVVWQALKDIPGELHQREWVNFGHNRTESLQYGEKTGTDYLLWIDADEVLVVDDPAVLDTIDKPAYRIEMRFPTISYPRVNLMRADLGWRFEGRIHEYAACEPPAPEFLISGVYMWTDGDGARGRSGTKHLSDLRELEHWVIDEPDNPRAFFYLAQTYQVAQRWQEALATYSKRAGMGGYEEEVWFSLYQAGSIHNRLGNWEQAVASYLAAFAADPKRVEPLYWLALGYQGRKQDAVAIIFLEAMAELHKPLSAMFVEDQIWDYLRWIHYCVCHYNLGHKDIAVEMAGRVLDAGKTPEDYLPALRAMIRESEQAAELVAVG